MKKLIFLASFACTLMITEIASAQGRFNNRNQQTRINQGVRHGQLTKNEARQLQMQQQRINSLKRMAMADGRVTPRERMMIRRAEQKANVAIRYQKNDRNYRW
ncbi:MAG TPA: hypothetical protein PL009_10840 [Flavipsychrobacter sp.]|nr:hypothetical protein [Flavipsychrobacter sp.]